MNNLVTVITPTTGSKYLKQAIESVQGQSYKNIQHLIFADGKDCHEQVKYITSAYNYNRDIIYLPYSVGKDRWNGHRMYFAGISLASDEAQYICFLDEDNWFDENHIESLVNNIEDNPWSFSLRKIVDSEGEYVCDDDCESLGNFSSVMSESDYFVDVNCFFLRRDIAVRTAPIWYRKAREEGVPEVDRALTHLLRYTFGNGLCSNKYTVNYRVGNTPLSVKKEFFIRGNDVMKLKYNNRFPWKNK